ncbi:MAG: FGGY family carbohydrate kinase [Planctomycetota bacterium]|nr:FGGY family carbohydrate kinase [Planctomycetota bacterium]
MKRYLIGLDIGSSFIKATLFDTRGEAVASAARDNHPLHPRPGVSEYSGPGMLEATYAALRSLREGADVDSRGVAAIGADGMISGIIGLDEAGAAATPFSNTLDMRFAGQLNGVLATMHEAIRRLCGSGQPTIGPKIMWFRDAFPDLYRRAEKFVTATGYVAGSLAGLGGEQAFIDQTHLWATGLADVQAGAWSDELCQRMGVTLEKLPRIVPPTEVVGGLCAAAAAATGLAQGTPVIAGLADQSAGFIGAGITRPGQMASVAGTYPVLTLCTDVFRPDMGQALTEILGSGIGGLYQPSTFLIGGGLTHHWFGQTFAGGAGPGVYAELDELASHVPPGSEKLLFNPHVGGRACPTRTNYKGAWVGFTWSHRREHFYRALLEAVAFDQVGALRAMRRTYPEMQPTEIVLFGGGARSSLWNQIKADVLGVPHVALARDDMSTLGAALVAGAAVGIYSDLTAAAQALPRQSTRFEPDPRRHDFYRSYAACYASLLAALDKPYDDLASLSDWTPSPA